MTEPEITPTPEPKPTLHQRILKVMDSLAYIQKGDKRVNGEYTFVSHDQVIQKLRPFLVDNGIILLTDVLEYKQVDFPPRLNKFGKEVYNSRTEATLNLRLVNADDPKDFIEGRAIGFGIDNGDKGPGKAISYAVKYFLLKNFCLETGDTRTRTPIRADRTKLRHQLKKPQLSLSLPRRCQTRSARLR